MQDYAIVLLFLLHLMLLLIFLHFFPIIFFNCQCYDFLIVFVIFLSLVIIRTPLGKSSCSLWTPNCSSLL